MRVGMVVGWGCILAGMLAACTAEPVLLRNPRTGDMAKCEWHGGVGFDPRATVEECARAYEQAGFVRTGP
jgi:hypothetical protein